MFKKKWNEELIIAHIMSKRKSEPLNAYYYSTTYPDIYAAAQRIFGSWRDAIESCGMEYLKIRKYRNWSKTRVVEEIKSLAKRREALNSNHVQDHRKPLYMAAIKRFKNWEAAMRAAGIDYGKIRLRRSMSKAELKKAVLELWGKGVDLAYPFMRLKHQWLLAAGMKKIGDGSWDKARKRCGIKVNFRLKGDRRVAAIAKALGQDVEVPSKKSVRKAKPVVKKAVAKKTVKKFAKPVARKAVKAIKGKGSKRNR